MAEYFKINRTASTLVGVALALLALTGCNKESVIEGAAPAKPTTVELNKDISPSGSTPTNITFKLMGTDVVVPFVFSITPINNSTSQYSFYSNAPVKFRWAVETYIRKLNQGDDITENLFTNGGTPYFISALKTGSNYSYTYNYSFNVNMLNYAGFKYSTTVNGENTFIYGWISFTASDNKITLHKYAYVLNNTLKAGIE